MTSTTRISSGILFASLTLAAALPTQAAPRDDAFWRQLQISDGVAIQQTSPLPVAGVAGEPTAPAKEWIVVELQKSEGYVAETRASAREHSSRISDAARAETRQRSSM